MAKKAYICGTCGFEFEAIPGEEEPPECPECTSDEIEQLEFAPYGGLMEELNFTPRKIPFSLKLV